MDERFPIGQFEWTGSADEKTIAGWIRDIESLPQQLQELVNLLTEEELHTPYREGGWTPLQVVHHLADSNMNAFIRFKLALTEDAPLIKPFDEASWAQEVDYELPVDTSLSLLKALHVRWAARLKKVTAKEQNRVFVHPVSGRVSVAEAIGMYAWHGRHHLAHIELVKKQ